MASFCVLGVIDDFMGIICKWQRKELYHIGNKIQKKKNYSHKSPWGSLRACRLHYEKKGKMPQIPVRSVREYTVDEAKVIGRSTAFFVGFIEKKRACPSFNKHKFVYSNWNAIKLILAFNWWFTFALIVLVMVS